MSFLTWPTRFEFNFSADVNISKDPYALNSLMPGGNKKVTHT